MNYNELLKLQQIFDKYDVARRNTVNIWQLRDILSYFGIYLNDYQLFTCLIEARLLNEVELAFNSIVLIIYQFKKKNYTSDYDEETYYAWLAVGGSDDKSGYIEVLELQKNATQLGMEVNIYLLLYAQAEARSKQSITSGELQIPTKLDYSEFKALMSAESFAY